MFRWGLITPLPFKKLQADQWRECVILVSGLFGAFIEHSEKYIQSFKNILKNMHI
jgi:hypothetical protein